jgi:hypothetical protein
MRAAPAQADTAVTLSSAPIATVAPSSADGAVALPQPLPLAARWSLPRIRVELGPLAGRLALASLVIGAVVLVTFSTAGPTALVPRSYYVYPGWEAGPLHLLTAGIHLNARDTGYGLSLLLALMTVAYAIALVTARRLSLRWIVAVVAALHLILLLSPPLQLTDLFNYMGYGRLGGLHHLNPYRHVIAAELHDPIYAFTTWRHLHSPYGPLFTAGSYLVGSAPLAVAYWALKLLAVAASLSFLGLVWWCARRLGRDPRVALAFVALNPLYLVYAVGGFHNDFFMLLPALAAVALLLAGRDRASGALLMVAVAVKFTAVLLLPFLLLAFPGWPRRWRLLAGAALAALPLAAGYAIVFGSTVPNLGDQSSLVTPFSIPNLVGWAVGAGTSVLYLANVVVAAAIAGLLWRSRNWLSAAGWGTLALLAGLSWLMPWYIAWALPLAALAGDRRLRQATLAFSLFLILSFLPADSVALRRLHVNPMNSPIGQISQAKQDMLSQ